MSSFKRRSIIIFRWLVFAPAAIAAAALARLILIVGNRWTMDRYVDPDSFLGSTWIIFISTVVYTAVLVHVSAYIAPTGKKAVSIVVATLATTVAVAVLVLSLMAKDYESTFYSICFATGACIASYSIVHGQIEMPGELPWDSDEYEGENASLRDPEGASKDLDEQSDAPKSRSRAV